MTLPCFSRGMTRSKNIMYVTLLCTWLHSLANIHQLYHSIHARGERVEDVIKDLETNNEDISHLENPGIGNLPVEANSTLALDLEDGELDEEVTGAGATNDANATVGDEVGD